MSFDDGLRGGRYGSEYLRQMLAEFGFAIAGNDDQARAAGGRPTGRDFGGIPIWEVHDYQREPYDHKIDAEDLLGDIGRQWAGHRFDDQVGFLGDTIAGTHCAICGERKITLEAWGWPTCPGSGILDSTAVEVVDRQAAGLLNAGGGS